MKAHILVIFLLFFQINLSAQKTITTQDIDWQNFLSQHDLLWDTIKPDYYSGALLGNGLLGANIYAADEGCYRWNIGRSDVTENRKGTNILYDKARLPIGFFKLVPQGKVFSENMRLVLWDATTQGLLETDKGKIRFKTYVDAHEEIIVIETQAEGQESVQWSWNPEHAVSPRTLFMHTHGGLTPEYTNNPNAVIEIREEGDFGYSIQRLFSGWVYVTAWHKQKTGNSQRMLVTVSYKTDADEAITTAKSTLNDYLLKDSKEAERMHRQWWHNYYPASFVSFPDARMESFYWIQQYKFACLTRQNKNIIDLMGPWTAKTPWPAIWWNLNVQLSYSPLFTANRMELSEPLWRAFETHKEALINNVPVEEWRKDAACIGRSSSYDLVRPLNPDEAERNMYEVGNLTWVLYYYWQYCIYKGDTEELLNKFYPLLKRSIAYYSHILYKGGDGKLHLPLAASPEYKPAFDCNYDLALLRWGMLTLLDINKQHKLKDTLQSYWEDVLKNLVDYPVDSEQGFMIGRDVKLESSHRHYSHLLMIYPLHMVNWEQPENHDIISKSLHHWIGMKDALQGYTFTGSSSMYSTMGNGKRAVEQLNLLLDKYIRPNTLYRETGPVIETPLSAVASLQELYLQSWNKKIRVFPAVPDEWKDASFINLRTEGGFLISAVRKNAVTDFIQTESTVGGVCRIESNMNIGNSDIRTINNAKLNYKIIDKQNGIVEFITKKGDIIQIKSKAEKGVLSFGIAHPQAELNYYGVRK